MGDDTDALRSAVLELKLACYSTGIICLTSGSLAKIQNALVKIEGAKVRTIARIARDNLITGMKVVICVNYLNSIDRLTELLSDYNPLVLTGSVKLSNRISVVDKFQQPDMHYPLLIANLQVCSTGIDLDDKDGRFKRCCIVNPNYSTISLYQLSHRFYRLDTASDSFIYFFFGKEQDTCELPILKALSEKSNVMKAVTSEQSDNGVIFPCDYATYMETKS